MDERYLTDAQVGTRLGVSRSTPWRWLKNKTMGFPKPIQLSPGCTRWKLSELIKWENSQSDTGRSG